MGNVLDTGNVAKKKRCNKEDDNHENNGLKQNIAWSSTEGADIDAKMPGTAAAHA